MNKNVTKINKMTMKTCKKKLDPNPSGLAYKICDLVVIPGEYRQKQTK
jgi:hypothetical protein